MKRARLCALFEQGSRGELFCLIGDFSVSVGKLVAAYSDSLYRCDHSAAISFSARLTSLTRAL